MWEDLGTPCTLPRCFTYPTGGHIIAISTSEFTQEKIRFLYGSAVLNGLGAALLWTSQVDCMKERKYCQERKKERKKKESKKERTYKYRAAGKLSLHQLGATYGRAQRRPLLGSLSDEYDGQIFRWQEIVGSLSDEWSPWLHLCPSPVPQGGGH